MHEEDVVAPLRSEQAAVQKQTSSASTSSKKQSVTIREPPPRMSVSSVAAKEKTLLHKAIPVMPLPLAGVCCFFNVFTPGFGTLLSAFTVFCCGSTRLSNKTHAFCLNLASALLQMLTFIVIVGWIWSIIWGMTFVQLAMMRRVGGSVPVPYYVRRQSSVETTLATNSYS